MNVNSYALFGEPEKWIGAVATNLRQHYTFYPSWTFWIHTDRELPETGYCGVVRKFIEAGLIKQTIVPNDGKYHHSRWKCLMMLWRLLPIWEGTNYVFCRDLDSILTPRQLQCTLEFIRSNKMVHGIRDNAAHDISLMGGMCGFRSQDFQKAMRGHSFEQIVQRGNVNWNEHGADQQFLMSFIWPKISSFAMIHNLQGQNSRYDMKHLFDVDISYLSTEVREQGDNFTNYIGAVGCNTDKRSYSDQEIAEFYNKYGNTEKCEQITKIEKDMGY